ncbi:hypothetical protein EW146_g3578 [Bondarzewia mesenterica]|uniref:Sm domain-containing protein n=1 Tax=Bondarzewia mesenterica TaxID=1095465 RepID=A0A4S4LYM6_9AGAM|nr:hypothetical protein EW146_g3578 [Bondarzewia mesenterica]
MADALKPLLRLLLRISITDGRIFLGTFVGTDKELNVLLIHTDEFRLGPAENPDGRYVGQVMIPWSKVVRVEVQAPGSDGGLDDGHLDNGRYL